MSKYGDLVTSDAHIEVAKGPYMVLIEVDGFVSCVNLDGAFVINIPKEHCRLVPIRKDIAIAITDAIIARNYDQTKN